MDSRISDGRWEVYMKYARLGEKLTIKCSVGKCPRTKRYIVQMGDEHTFPEGTVVIKMKCPWHDEGDFDQEEYFDKDGNELIWEPEADEAA